MSKTNKAQEEAQKNALAQEDVQPEVLNTLKPAAGADELASPRMDSPLERVEDMEALATLADRHRIPTWQQAALMRHMGWDEGKKVSNADYESALQALKHRRMGGGRKE